MRKTKAEYQKKFRETHKTYYRDYMRAKRKKQMEAKIQAAFELIYGKEN